MQIWTIGRGKAGMGRPVSCRSTASSTRQKRRCHQPDGPVDFLLKRNSVYYLVGHGRRGEAIGFAILALLVIWWRGLLQFRSATPAKGASILATGWLPRGDRSSEARRRSAQGVTEVKRLLLVLLAALAAVATLKAQTVNEPG
jgi:hypothetical protein